LALNRQLATLDPSTVFGTPERVRDSAELTRDEKIDILRRWAYDVSEIAVAVEEGMREGDRNDLQHRILLALGALADDLELELEHTGPAKQHGLPVATHAANALGQDSEENT
jgi:hypothetical protein